MELTPKKELIIKIICLLILLILNIAIVVNGLSLSCDKCVIIKTEHIPGMKDDILNEVKLIDIYNNLNNGTCEWIKIK